MAITELYSNYLKAEAAFKTSSIDDDNSLDLMWASDAAYSAYSKALSVARAQWMVIPPCAARDSAETNADDTEGTDEDELRWFQIALSTYEMNMGEADFDENGNYV